MKIEKDKRKVNIVCMDKSIITGFIYVDPGLRVIDYMNRLTDPFIIVSNAELQNLGEIHAFKLYNELKKKKNMICLNKASVKWIEEL
jgi:hypothetical protein